MTNNLYPEYVPKNLAREYDENVVYLTVKDMARKYPDLSERSFHHILKTKPLELPCIQHRGRSLIHPDDFATWIKHRSQK